MKMTYNALRDEVMNAMQTKPNNWRKGQFVFNYIDAGYGVARAAQFDKGVDCFYNDDIIDEFIKVCAELININQLEDDSEMSEDQYKGILNDIKAVIKPNTVYIHNDVSGTLVNTTDKYRLQLNAIAYYDNDKLTDIIPIWWNFYLNDKESDLFSFSKIQDCIK